MHRIIHKWFPPKVDRETVFLKLAEFYRTNRSYHEMTAGEDKASHPQVDLLQCLLNPRGHYAEVGCGGGVVTKLVGEIAQVLAFDCSPIAVEKALRNCAGTSATITQADATSLSLADNVVDGFYSFELLEHVWDPVAVLAEMARVTKPGGFILVSMPNHFSLDLHLEKKPLVRRIELVCARIRILLDRLAGVTHHHLTPDIDGDVYPDCDMITSVLPYALEKIMRELGCEVEFIDTYYMCAQRERSGTDLSFQRNARHPFLRYFGDHTLMLAKKKLRVKSS